MISGRDPRQIPRAVAVTADPASRTVTVTLTDGTALRADLTGWIATGGAALARLRDPVTFSRVAVADFGAALEWDGAADLALDMAQLEALADQQASFSAAELDYHPRRE
jgi:hypothetical protein